MVLHYGRLLGCSTCGNVYGNAELAPGAEEGLVQEALGPGGECASNAIRKATGPQTVLDDVAHWHEIL